MYAYGYGMFRGATASFSSYTDCTISHAAEVTYGCGGLGAGAPVTIAAIDTISTFAVAAWDIAGNQAVILDSQGQSVATYVQQTFYAVKDQTRPLDGHLWSFSKTTTSGCANPQVPDSPGAAATAAPMSISGDACWSTSTVPQFTGQASVLSFGGNASTVTTATNPPPALIDTSQSFTVGTWVNATSGGPAVQTFLDQEGTTEGAFFLQLVNQKFSFCMSTTQASSFSGDCITGSPDIGFAWNTWYYVAATWDAVNHRISLFISDSNGGIGTPVATGYHEKSWTATSSARLGTDLIGANRRYFKGLLDDPFMANGLLVPTQISKLAQHHPFSFI